MENNLIVKSNNLIEARYSLNLNEQKILLYAISRLNREDKELNIVEFDVVEFTQLIDTKGKRYEDFRDTVRSLRKREIIIDTKEKELITGWLSNISFYKNTGKVRIKFDDELIPYLLQLKSRFTRYELKNILYLKNKYSIRIYELLKQYEKIGIREIELKKLKETLMLDEKQYERIYDFERFVLKPSKKEIDKNTDIIMNYKKIKTGRTVTSILFKIEPKDQEKEIYVEYLNQNYNIKEFKLKSGLEKENFNSEQIIELFTIATEKLSDAEQQDLFDYIKINYLHMLENETVKNKYAYLKKALQEDYAVARGQIKLNFKIFD